MFFAKCKSMLVYQLLVVHLAIIIVICNGTISPGKTRSKKKSSLQAIDAFEGVRNQSLQELKLIKPDTTSKDILTYHGTYHRNISQRHFNGTVLGYLTPWNSLGYKISQRFVNKFDIISPVWFQVIRDDKENKYLVTGSDVVNSTWLNSLSKHQQSTKIFPRFIIEKFSNLAYNRLFSVPGERSKMAKAIWETCNTYGFEGIIFEFWLQLAGLVHKWYTVDLVVELSRELRALGNGLEMVLVVPPFRKEMPNAFTADDFNKLYKHVYGFSLMTYDYSSVQRPGANAPLYWIRQAIDHLVPGGTISAQNSDIKLKRSKILMGMNMYGNVYTPDGGKAITGNEYLALLRQYMKRLNNDEHDGENYFEIRNSEGHQYVFYPSLYSINERLKLATDMGVGIALWELGQGLDYFYDLL